MYRASFGSSSNYYYSTIIIIIKTKYSILLLEHILHNNLALLSLRRHATVHLLTLTLAISILAMYVILRNDKRTKIISSNQRILFSSFSFSSFTDSKGTGNFI